MTALTITKARYKESVEEREAVHEGRPAGAQHNRKTLVCTWRMGARHLIPVSISVDNTEYSTGKNI